MTIIIISYKVKFWSKLLRKFCEQEFESFDEAYTFSKSKLLVKIYAITKKALVAANA